MTDVLNSVQNLAGIVILAGGASERMGTPKAKLTLPSGEYLLDYHVKRALSLDVPIMIADNGRSFTVKTELLNQASLPIFHIIDYDRANGAGVDGNKTQRGGGALVAIESALQALLDLVDTQHTSSSWLMVISCDSLIPATVLWQQLQPSYLSVKDKKVVCLADEHYLYPLLGLYHLSLEPTLRSYLDKGQRRVRSFVDPIAHRVLCPKNWQYATNFNTPEAFEQACSTITDWQNDAKQLGNKKV